MTQRDIILQELLSLESSLANNRLQNIYDVPESYFEGLANEVINRIKAINAETATEEISFLSPFLQSFSKQNPYSIPVGYFDILEEKILTSLRKTESYQTPKEELEVISPLLSGLNKQMPYSIPDGYFETIGSEIPQQEPALIKSKAIPLIHRKWFRYAAAAAVISFISLGGLLFEHRPGIDPEKNPDEWIAKNIKKVSADKLDTFISLTDEESTSKETTGVKDVQSNEIKELLKDVPENQIQDFLNETAALGKDNAIMN